MEFPLTEERLRAIVGDSDVDYARQYQEAGRVRHARWDSDQRLLIGSVDRHRCGVTVSPTELAHRCSCGQEKKVCWHALALVLHYIHAGEREEDRSKRRTDPEDVCYHVLLSAQTFSAWPGRASISYREGADFLKSRTASGRLICREELPPGHEDLQLFVGRERSLSESIHTGSSGMSKYFHTLKGHPRVFIEYPDRRLQRIEVSTDIYRLALRVAADPKCGGQLRIEPRLDEAGARMLINPVYDHDDRERDGITFGWVFWEEAGKLAALPDAGFKFWREYDALLVAARDKEILNRPVGWLAWWWDDLCSLFRIEESDGVAMLRVEEDPPAPDFPEGSRPLVARDYSHLFLAPQKYAGRVSRYRLTKQLKPAGFVPVSSIFSFARPGKLQDLWHGLVICDLGEFRIRAQGRIAIDAHGWSRRWQYDRIIKTMNADPILECTVLPTKEEAAEWEWRLADTLDAFFEQYEDERGVELIETNRRLIDSINVYLPILEKLIEDDCKLFEDSRQSYAEYSRTLNRNDNWAPVTWALAAWVLQEFRQNVPEESAPEIATEADWNEQRTMLLADRIAHFADDRVVDLLERAGPPPRGG